MENIYSVAYVLNQMGTSQPLFICSANRIPKRTAAHTGLGYKVIPRLRECCKQSQAEVVSKSSSKIHQTWGLPFSRALYTNDLQRASERLKEFYYVSY